MAVRATATILRIYSPGNLLPLTVSWSNNYGPELDRMIAQGTVGAKGDGLGGWDADTFTMQMWGNFPFHGGKYIFTYGSDDGIQVFVGNQNIIDDWEDQSFKFQTKEVFIPAGIHQITVWYYENRWAAGVYLDWSPKQ